MLKPPKLYELSEEPKSYEYPDPPKSYDESAEPKAEADGSQYFIEVPSQIQRKNKDVWIDVSLYFLVDLNDDEITGEFVYAFEATESGPSEVSLKSGDRIRPVFLVVSDDGDEIHVASDDDALILDVDDPDDLSVGSLPVPADTYEVGFQVYDFSDNFSERFVEIQVTK